jgi:hypothetical protein
MTDPDKPGEKTVTEEPSEPNYLVQTFVAALAAYEDSSREDPAGGTSAKSDTDLVADLPARW